jgi:hypothetical protein
MSFEIYNNHVENIKGWYVYDKINPILESINNFHRSNNIESGICEIGIYQGKSFLALCCLSTKDEKKLAIDSFGNFKETDWMYGKGEDNKTAFEENYFKIFNNKDYTLLQENSNKVTSEQIINICNGKPRLFSIDGDHTVNGTYHDLQLAKYSICDYGVIIVDDYTNSGWPTVKEGTDLFLKENTDILYLKCTYNKLFLCKNKDFDILNKIVNNYVS